MAKTIITLGREYCTGGRYIAEDVAKALGIAPSSSYELMHEKDFPALRIGNRIVVPKEAFIRWVEQHTGGAE